MSLTTLFFILHKYVKKIYKLVLHIVFYGNTQINWKARKENVKFRTKVDLHDFIIFIFVYDKNQRFSCWSIIIINRIQIS